MNVEPSVNLSGAPILMSPTYVIELTPPGRGAVAVVLVDGPEAVHAVNDRFAAVSGRPISDAPIGKILFGRWGGAGGEELVVCRRGADQVEVHCHGGALAVGRIVGDLVEGGCCHILWQEWVQLRRSRVSPKLGIASSPRRIVDRKDATTWAARMALAEARTERTAAILLDQFNGALTEAIERALTAISAADWSLAAATVDELLGRGELGLHLVAPWRVVFAGAPNVGKSSLMNALAGFQRAIVSPLPGTTRDVVTLSTAIDGWPVQLTDTAGLRDSQDELETAGVALATMALTGADLVLFVHDATNVNESLHLEEGGVEKFLSDSAQGRRIIHVVNKIDLVRPSERSRIRLSPSPSESGAPHVRLASALTGEHVTELVTAIGSTLVPEAPPPGAAIPFAAEHFETLAGARAAIERRDARAAATALQAMLAGRDHVDAN